MGGFYSVYGQTQKVNEKPAAIDKTETCRSNPKHTYQIFIPPVEKSASQLPLLVVIDPHGDGKLAVSGFREAAGKYQVVVAGSNLIKNNDRNYLHELEELITDIRSRYPVGNILLVGGFSGGARMAVGYALSHPVSGVLACGALAQKEEITALPCRVMCIIGMEDFNFVEAAPFVMNPMGMPSNLSVETAKDTHGWPGKTQLGQALGFLMLSALPSSAQSSRQKMIGDFVAEQKQRIGSLKMAGKIVEAALIARNMAGCPAFSKESALKSAASDLTQGSEFKNQVAELNKNIQFEMNVRNAYLGALTQKDSVWWKPEIKSLNSKIAGEKNEMALQTYKRIKGFLGIACYSLSNRFVEAKDPQKLEQIIAVYRLVEPANPEIKTFEKTLAQLKKGR